MTNIERRAFSAEMRMGTNGGKSKMIGRAAVFNSRSEVMSMQVDGKSVKFQEIIMPGAFRSALVDADIRALFNHDPNLILGRTGAETLRVAETDGGLDYEVDPPDTSYARDLQVSMGRGDVSQCSFGFTVKKGGDKWEREAGGSYLRTILPDGVERVYDVSPVTYPAYPDTDCAMRSLGASHQDIPPIVDHASEARKRNMEMESAYGGVEQRVSMGWNGENTIGRCTCCNMVGCLCPGCANVSCCNMQVASAGGACTKCMQPGCLCLTCPNTDQCCLLKMYSM